jgi:hypothetical protein
MKWRFQQGWFFWGHQEESILFVSHVCWHFLAHCSITSSCKASIFKSLYSNPTPSSHFLFLYVSFFKIIIWQYWGLNSGLCLARHVLYNLSHIPSPFFLWLFWRKGLAFCSGLPGPWSSYIRLPIKVEMTGKCHHTQLLVEMGILLTFCLGWPGTIIFLISASQVARIFCIFETCLCHSHIGIYDCLLCHSQSTWIIENKLPSQNP